MATLQGQIADAIIAAAENNKDAIIAAIQAAENGLEAFLAQAVDNVQPPKGLLSLIWPTIKSAIIQELMALEAATPGSVIFGILDTEAHALAKSIGG